MPKAIASGAGRPYVPNGAMASPPRLPQITTELLAWGAAAAGGLAGLVLLADRPLVALLAWAAAAAGALIAWQERQNAPQIARNAEPVARGFADLTQLLEALPDAALLVDSEGRVAGSNAAARARLQFDVAGLRLSSILRQPDLLDAAQDAAAEGETRTVEYETAGQVEEHVRCYVAPVQWEGARAALIVFHDETARIATERMRADFLANASHELRTPLAALMLLIETIGGPARDNAEDRARFLAMMQVQGERMRRLIDDLLSLSRIEMDEHVPPSDRADLVEVAREVADALEGVAAEKKVRIEIAGPAKAGVVGDRFQLVQVVQNLVDNAMKYSPPGAAVSVEVGLAEGRAEVAEQAGRRWPEAGRIALLTPDADAPTGYAYVRVTDAGPGIARRFLPKLGARFFRVEREMGAEKGGTGLGLAIVKHIVNRHRGGMVVESQPGQGSAFAAYVERAP